MADKNQKVGQQNDNDRLKGSASDPQNTELQGLKEGGVDPVVYPGDKEKAKEKPARPSTEE